MVYSNLNCFIITQAYQFSVEDDLSGPWRRPPDPWLHAPNMIRAKHRRKLKKQNWRRTNNEKVDSSSVLLLFLFLLSLFQGRATFVVSAPIVHWMPFVSHGLGGMDNACAALVTSWSRVGSCGPAFRSPTTASCAISISSALSGWAFTPSVKTANAAAKTDRIMWWMRMRVSRVQVSRAHRVFYIEASLELSFNFKNFLPKNSIS